ncbi:hypothetical protein [Costertonia aggregata]|uniref:Uncharacterized protein n=1 Tax=Costertonia aggregata TaxID=343403 RepID=A0A7H9ANQ6_9FLAO|nr:hypothetical protein [Costertonia aggregata]QLG45067.1 hypothetical protein HYG79_06790 [Costertonia aggregata]
MKTLRMLSLFLITAIFMTNCSSESNNEPQNENNATGTIRMSGEDTAAIGNELQVGDIDYGRVDLTGLEDSIIVVHQGATIVEESPTLSPGDPGYVESIIDAPDTENGFIIVAGEQVVSMTIVTNGVQRQYGCDSTFGTFTDCNTISINKDLREAVFMNTTVQNVETGAILTMNGTLRW